jgi:hypothetical protein
VVKVPDPAKRSGCKRIPNAAFEITEMIIRNLTLNFQYKQTTIVADPVHTGIGSGSDLQGFDKNRLIFD